VTQRTFETSADVRDHLMTALRGDIFGADTRPQAHDAHMANHETLRPGIRPSSFYLFGFLVPADEVAMATAEQEQGIIRETISEEQDDANAPAQEDEGGGREQKQRSRLQPSSLGLTVFVAPDCEGIDATVRFANYIPEPPISEDILKGAPKSVADEISWRRDPRTLPYKISRADIARALDTPGGHEILLQDSAAPSLAGGGVTLHIVAMRCRLPRPLPRAEWPEGLSVTVFVVNRRTAANRFKDVSNIFQVGLTLETDACFIGNPDMSGFEANDFDLRLHDLHYADVLRFVGGRNIGTGHDGVTDDRASRVWSDPLPTAHVEKVDQNAAIDDITIFNMGALADLTADPEKLANTLARFPAAYLSDFIATQAERVASIQEKRRREVAETLVDNQRLAHARMVAGVELLRTNNQAQLAFRAMNLAIRSYLENTRKIADPAWRPFQLAFILLNLRGLTDKLSDDRDIVDLLFFPTGGGKTEAYLGLAAYQIALRRLTNPDWLGSGVSVIMRYTLRLLTLDQLGRAAAMICALELLRRSDEWKDERGQALLGPAPIEIGLWVGSGATPNKIGGRGQQDTSPPRNAYGKIEWYRSNRGSSPAPITECPWCGTAFNRDTYRIAGQRMLINCDNLECDFSAAKGGLPVLAVDEEIYNRLPAFIVATLDKFAALPRKGEIGRFFNHVDRIESADNPQHLTFLGADAPGMGRLLDPQRECLPPPDLIIQDELHLISGPLGTIAGLYEAAIDRLASRNINGRLRGPKIIASTATVRRADDQIKKLFDRDKTAIFPAPGIDRRNSYFAVVTDAPERQRLYVGISALGIGPRKVFLRAVVPLLAAAQHAYNLAAAGDGKENPADAYMTALCYFNALRELGATRRIVEDEVAGNLADWPSRRLRPLGDTTASPFARRQIGLPEELTSRDSTDKVAETKKRLALSFGSAKSGNLKPLDVALATNMISVGLDISRLGLMIVQNQPKGAAEYIQATSRVGRDDKRPGLVAVILNMHRARDRAHYEDFETYHQAFYRAVEATSVTPAASGALDRALGAVFAGLIRHLDPTFTGSRGPQSMQPDHPIVREAAHFLGERFECEDAINRLIEGWMSILSDKQGEGLNWDTHGNDDGGLLHTPLQDLAALRADFRLFEAGWSMRDVQPGVAIEVEQYLEAR
jgi:hypothetical protein